MDNELVSQDLPGPFTESGKIDDEVSLEFDCSKTLYVSRNFLRYASPVFEAMFNNDFIEKKQNYVKLTGKNFEDFTEFLLCIHPRILKPVTESNALQISPIAEEYQVTSITEKCKECMRDLFSSSVQTAGSKSSYHYHAEPLRVCIRVLATAVQLNYSDVVDIGVKTIAKFGHVHYNRNQQRPPAHFEPSPETKVKEETLDQIQKDCLKLFEQLPVEIRCKIFSERLLRWSDNNLK